MGRSASSGTQYVLREIRKALDRPTRQEVLQRLADRPTRRMKTSAAEVIRAERDAR